jgi:hypothetical protein
VKMETAGGIESVSDDMKSMEYWRETARLCKKSD